MSIYHITYFLLISCGIIIYFFKRKFRYWEFKNVPFLPPRIPFGHSPPFFGKGSFQATLEKTYKHFREEKQKHCGLYSFFLPLYMPLDLELIKNIMTKDFHHFVSRGLYYNEKSDPISAHLVTLDGELWRSMRTKLTPTFTSGKMKNMFPIFLECSSQMVEAISKMKEAFDVKEVMACYTTDVIGNCAFGLKCNSFEDDQSEFRSFGKRALKPTLRGTLVRIFVNLFAGFAKKIGVRVVHPEVSKFFMEMVRKTVNYREKNGVHRNDFLQILLDLKNKETGVTIEQIAANSFVFFLAGFDTSATTLNFALYELSKNEEIQDRAKREILDVLGKHNNELTYESLKEIKYLDQIIDETLRMYAPAPLSSRSCTIDYKIPDTNTVIEKGTRVIIPIVLMHMDEEYYENPTKFDPERFSEENKQKIPQGAFIPFGEGPRACIGSRFGLMQTKIGLALLLKNYKFSLNPKTEQPLVFNPRSIILTTIHPIYLNAHKVA